MKKFLKNFAERLPTTLGALCVSLYRRIRYRFSRQYKKITPLPPSLDANLKNCHGWFWNASHYFHANRLDGVYVEFGSHEANTFRIALNTLGNYARWGKPHIQHFYAFDSFQGMPEPRGIDKQKIWRAGMNFTSEDQFNQMCKYDSYRITTVKGFYDDVLPTYQWNHEHLIVLAYIDCDYYSSAVSVLQFIKNKLTHGAILAFDDWNCYYGDPKRGEKRAFREFQEAVGNEVHFEPFLPISFGGMSFICLQKKLMGKEIL